MRLQQAERELERPAARKPRPKRERERDEDVDEFLSTSRAPEPNEFFSSLARTDERTRERTLARLQSLGGNASVGRMIQRARRSSNRFRFVDPEPVPELPEPQSFASVVRFDVAATIDQVPEREQTAREPDPAPSIGLAADAKPGAERHVQPEDLAPFLEDDERADGPKAAQMPAPTAQTAGATVKIPDIVIPSLVDLESADAVAGTLGYKSTVERGGGVVLPNDWFGGTWWGDLKLTDISVTPDKGTFKIAATAEHKIKYEVRNGLGVDNQVDIASVGDGDISDENYPDVVKALTPNYSSDNGRPPRTGFWAEDLTLKHECFHAEDAKGKSPAAVNLAVEWLKTKTASNVGEVQTLVTKVPGRIVASLSTAMKAPEREQRAYGDGAPSYESRVKAIERKGKAGSYPKKAKKAP